MCYFLCVTSYVLLPRLPLHKVFTMLNKKSGLLGMCGSNDMREVCKQAGCFYLFLRVLCHRPYMRMHGFPSCLICHTCTANDIVRMHRRKMPAIRRRQRMQSSLWKCALGRIHTRAAQPSPV